MAVLSITFFLGFMTLFQQVTCGVFPGFKPFKMPNMEPEINWKVKQRVDDTSAMIRNKLNDVQGHLDDLMDDLTRQRSELEALTLQAEMDPNSVAGVNARIQRLMKFFPDAVCPQTQGFTVHKQSGLRYSIGAVKAKRQDALRLCIGKKATLVKLDTEDKVNAMKDIIGSISGSLREGFYIGADYFLDKKEGFQWKNHTFLDSKLSPWDKGWPTFPDQGPRKDCVIAVYVPNKDKVVWRNVQCWEEHKFICQI